jgi:hypothetical protein
MLIDTKTDKTFCTTDTETGEILMSIEVMGNNVYKAKSKFLEITAFIKPLDEYRTMTECIENKKADKNGRYRKNKELAEHNTLWLKYMLEEKGFIRKSIPTA